MSYTRSRTNWVDYPDTSTLIRAADLNNIEAGIVNAWASLAQQIYNVKDYGAIGDGVTDDSTAISTALAAANTAGGGVVYLPPGTYLTGAQEIKARVWLKGAGRDTSVLKQKAATNSNYFIYMHISTNGTSDPDAFMVRVSDLGIDGNKANQSSGTGVGLYHQCTSSGGNPATSDQYKTGLALDTPQNTFENISIINMRGAGVSSGGLSANTYKDIKVYKCDGNGFELGIDSFYVNCEAGWSGLAGFYSNTTNAMLATCKAYYSGQVTGSAGHGFKFDTNSYLNTVVSCIAQDNKANGFEFDTCEQIILQGVVADSNSTSSTGTYVGFDIWNATECIIDGIAVERRVDGVNSRQQNALQIRTSAVRNRIRLTHAGRDGGTVGTAIKSSSDSVSGNIIQINASGGTQTVAYTTPITPDPYAGETVKVGTLTNAQGVVIQNPSNAHQGSRLGFMFTQDGTGGRPITFSGTQYKYNWTPSTTAGKINTILFEFDGTNWVQMSSATGL